MPVTRRRGAAVATVDIHAELNDYRVDRHFEFAVRPAWPEVVTTTPMALEAGKPEHLGAAREPACCRPPCMPGSP